MSHIPFNRLPLVGDELRYVEEAIADAHVSAGGRFTLLCEEWLEQRTGGAKAFLVHSCTAALELSALLLELEPGDEVIMPSFTFVSTANAFVLRGAVPVFVDIHPETLTLDERQIEPAVTERTRAVAAVHYAGVPCDMDPIASIASDRGLLVVEDAAQAFMSTYKGRPAGSLGTFGAFSFHETKNVTSGEGGVLLVNDGRFVERAEVLRNKGTDRARFFRGEVDKYTWVDVGSSYGPSELNAAFLWAQLQAAERLTADRLRLWDLYDEALAPLEEEGLLRRPRVPEYATHNAHMYYVLVSGLRERTEVIEALNVQDINAVFHFVPLHLSAGGMRYGRAASPLPVTEDVADRLIRLPLWSGMTENDVARVADTLSAEVRQRRGVASA